ncbi:16S rRNA (guanine(1207)-N(2))-methyltransferase RsmC [Maricurvus nonylphenolicus]|uniref:methyltransferase n=1 Tax=Maricurvus nonylphenolicus TaxID=1008307 RepID=UPI0036F20EE2
MSDQAFSLLQQHLLQHGDKALWIADENALQIAQQLSWVRDGLTAITNRIDVQTALETAGVDCKYNDWQGDSFEPNSLEQVFYRVSKEKPVVHHLINSAFTWLKPGGQLILCGQKNDGTKSYIDKAGKLFGEKARPQKNGQIYHASITKQLEANNDAHLDCSQYPELRPIAEIPPLNLWSKPGVFGWNKIDRGSELLVNHLQDWLPESRNELSMLDLGCGYGYITLMASQFNPAKLIATDNNATALLTISENAKQNDLDIEIHSADCADTIKEKVDIVLCNPPFHQGFSIDGGLTDKFLRQTSRLLKPAGKALFVVNQFIPLERKAAEYFNHSQCLLEQDGFKLIELSN